MHPNWLRILEEHNGTVPVVRVTCIRCGRSASERDEGYSDDEAVRLFNKKGWSVKPTLCSVHRSAEMGEEK